MIDPRYLHIEDPSLATELENFAEDYVLSGARHFISKSATTTPGTLHIPGISWRISQDHLRVAMWNAVSTDRTVALSASVPELYQDAKVILESRLGVISDGAMKALVAIVTSSAYSDMSIADVVVAIQGK